MAKRIKVLVVGNLTHDLQRNSVVLGGCAYYCSMVYKLLGADVTIITNIGTDFKFLNEFRNIKILYTKAGLTTTFINSYKKDGSRIQQCVAECSPIILNDFKQKLHKYDLVHLAPVLDEINLEEWQNLEISKYICVGIQGWLKKINQDKTIYPQRWTDKIHSLKGIDVAFMSHEDLISNQDFLEICINTIPIVVKTKGENGCDIHTPNKKITLEAFDAECIDPTGAGDSFSAAFMNEFITGKPIVECGKTASAVASLVIEAFGGRAFKKAFNYKERIKEVKSYNDLKQSNNDLEFDSRLELQNHSLD